MVKSNEKKDSKKGERPGSKVLLKKLFRDLRKEFWLLKNKKIK